MSRVELARRARPEIVDLDWPLSDAVVEALGLLEREPAAGHLLRGRLCELRSLRVGAYRIIYKLTTISVWFACSLSATGPFRARPIRAERQAPNRDLMRSCSSGRCRVAPAHCCAGAPSEPDV